LFRSLGNFGAGEPCSAGLVDKNGLIIFHKGVEPLSERLCGEDEFETLTHSRDRFIILEHSHIPGEKHRYVMAAPLEGRFLTADGARWWVFMETDDREISVPLMKLFAQMIAVTGGLFILLIPVGFVFSGRIAKPITDLNEAVKHIGKGEMEYPVDVRTGDEIEDLSVSFKNLVADLRDKQEKMEEARAYAENIISSMNDILIVIGPDAAIRRVNKATCDLLGYREDELLGKDISLIFIEEETLFKGKRPGELSEEGSLQNFDMTCRTKTGEKIPLSFSGSVMHGADNKIHEVISIGRDMRQVKALVDELKASKSELEEWSRRLEERVNERTADIGRSQRALINILEDLQESKADLENSLSELKEKEAMLIQGEKLASLGTMVSSIAHEVNNPLMVISGEAELLLMGDIADPEMKESLDTIVSECQRTKDMIKRLLRFSKISLGEKEEADINEALEGVIKIVEHQFSLRGVRISRSFNEGIKKATVEIKALEEVFINLINNAADAMPDGGDIVVSTKIQGESLLITFKDNGCGMSEEIKDKIFNPFFTTKEGGTGLGLPVCYGIVKNHGGDIAVESGEGKGTTFTISIPV